MTWRTARLGLLRLAMIASLRHFLGWLVSAFRSSEDSSGEPWESIFVTHHGSASAEKRVSVLGARMSETQLDAFCKGGSSPPDSACDTVLDCNAVNLGHERRTSA